MNLALECALVTALSLTFYVVLDGFDLGVGALMATTADRDLRDRLARSIEPTWDGNETWLIMAGVSLLGAFPLAYSILLPALYIPLVAMLIGLGLRAVAFDFRHQPGPLRNFWDRAFAVGSIVAALMQGVALGALVQGVEVSGDSFSGSALDVFRPLPALAGLTVLASYAVLGAGWARWRLPARDRAFADSRLRRAAAAATLVLVLAAVVAVTVQPALRSLWAHRGLPLLGSAVLLVAALVGAWRASYRSDALAPFVWSLAAAVAGLGLIGFVIFPDIIPFRLSLWAAAAPSGSQTFYFFGAIAVLPVILAYTGFAYWTFRGKVE